MLKKIISIAVSSIAVLSIVGCSNQSPLSVDNNENTPAKEAYFNDITASDLGGCGGRNWAVHNTDKYGSDAYLYYFNTQTAKWIKSSHWGKRLAVAGNGRCYHFNSGNEIWCCKYKGTNTLVDSSGFVTRTMPTGRNTITDIGAGSVSSNTDFIWILCDNKHIYVGQVINNVFTKQWQYKGVLPGNNIHGWSIASDPYKGKVAYVSAAQYQVSGGTTATTTKIYDVTNGPSITEKCTGQTLLNLNNYVILTHNGTDVAVYNGKLLYVDMAYGDVGKYGVYLYPSTQPLRQVSRFGLFNDAGMYGFIQPDNRPNYVQW